MWQVNILTLFPQIFPGPLKYSLAGRALCDEKWSLYTYDIRDYTKDRHKSVDDTPYGGGGGMIARPDVLGVAIESVFIPNGGPIIYFSPRGHLFNQNTARDFIKLPKVNFLCCRFEGIDERIIDEYDMRELSIGDYVLSSGDVAALVVIDACVRLIDGVLDANKALNNESFGFSSEYSKLLEYPHYTKPRLWKDRYVPEVLLNGHHAEIERWRLNQAQIKTKNMRPDLWEKYLASVVKK